jgi:threonine synthase
MHLYNTNNRSQKSTFKNAVFQGLADGNGLFMPESLPLMPAHFYERLPNLSFTEMALEVTSALLQDEIPHSILKEICEEAFSFPVPLVPVGEKTFCLELFHGPSLAFKDFGARFMSRIMAWFNREEKKPLHVLVATSGDTGGAVAMGFHNVPGIRVTILYPKERVSKYQEVQLTCLGGNVRALEVDGTFDDCQALVKQAFQDRALSEREGLTSANSINIARLIPQSLYYFHAWALVQKISPGARVVFSVPSGNFGNICAGAFAAQMGLPVEKLIASVNANRVFPDFLETGIFNPKPSIATLANAMDVGNPSNFVRIEALLGGWENVKSAFKGYSFSDPETEVAELELFEKYGYLSEPHAAIGFLGLQKYREETGSEAIGVFLGTAHPAKFIPVLPSVLKDKVEVPESLLELIKRPPLKRSMKVDFDEFREMIPQP